MVINNKIAFIPIPKNASWSVEDTCIHMGLGLTYPNKLWENSIKLNKKNEHIHIHSRITDLLESHNTSLEYVCIIRNSTDRLVSAWKFFISSIIEQIDNEEISDRLKNLDNDFLIEFIKENYNLLQNAYNSPSQYRTAILQILFNKMGILSILENDLQLTSNQLNERYTNHIITFTSQYNWILNDRVNVKRFDFENLKEFENYISNKLNIEFKLLHTNKSKLDYSAVKRTGELELIVEKYIDNINFQKKTLI